MTLRARATLSAYGAMLTLSASMSTLTVLLPTRNAYFVGAVPLAYAASGAVVAVTSCAYPPPGIATDPLALATVTFPA